MKLNYDKTKWNYDKFNNTLISDIYSQRRAILK